MEREREAGVARAYEAKASSGVHVPKSVSTAAHFRLAGVSRVMLAPPGPSGESLVVCVCVCVYIGVRVRKDGEGGGAGGQAALGVGERLRQLVDRGFGQTVPNHP
jgi:hypothetical protein